MRTVMGTGLWLYQLGTVRKGQVCEVFFVSSFRYFVLGIADHKVSDVRYVGEERAHNTDDDYECTEDPRWKGFVAFVLRLAHT